MKNHNSFQESHLHHCSQFIYIYHSLTVRAGLEPGVLLSDSFVILARLTCTVRDAGRWYSPWLPCCGVLSSHCARASPSLFAIITTLSTTYLMEEGKAFLKAVGASDDLEVP